MSVRALIGFAVGVVLFGAPRIALSQGDTGFTGQAGMTYYGNSDDLQVINPWVAANQQITERWLVNAGWEADVISAATVDIVTAATAPFEETRHGFDIGGTATFGPVRAGLGYNGSFEADTHAHTPFASGEIDLMQRNLTVGLAYGLSLTQLGVRHSPMDHWKNRWIHQIDAMASQVFTKTTIGSLSYTMQIRSGLLHSPYQRVPVFPTEPDQWIRPAAQWVAERHPDNHIRHALSFGARQSLGPHVFLHGRWRGFLDTWAMRSNAGEVGVDFDVGNGIMIETNNRFYWQSQVSFFRPIYTVNREFMTRDRRFGEMYSNITRFALRPTREEMEGVLSFELHWTRYGEFYSLVGDNLEEVPDTWAGIFGIGFAYSP